MLVLDKLSESCLRICLMCIVVVNVGYSMENEYIINFKEESVKIVIIKNILGYVVERRIARIWKRIVGPFD